MAKRTFAEETLAAAAVLAIWAAIVCSHAAGGDKVFRAGAAVVDVTPPKFLAIVSGYTFERTAACAVDRLAARSLVLDDGACRVAMVVVDSCVMPRSLLDRAANAAPDCCRARHGRGYCWTRS